MKGTRGRERDRKRCEKEQMEEKKKKQDGKTEII